MLPTHPPKPKIRVMLVDDHAVLRAGLKMLIDGQEDMQVVAESDSIFEITAKVQDALPDVIMLDLTLPGGSALDAIEKLSTATGAKVLVLTMHDDTAYAVAAMSAGATGYLVKSLSEQEVLAGIRSVHRGRALFDLDDQRLNAELLGILSHRKPGSPASSLSAREQEVLVLLGKGWTNQAIAESLDISPKTVATYRARIGEKLGIHSTADFVRYAHELGIL